MTILDIIGADDNGRRSESTHIFGGGILNPMSRPHCCIKPMNCCTSPCIIVGKKTAHCDRMADLANCCPVESDTISRQN